MDERLEFLRTHKPAGLPIQVEDNIVTEKSWSVDYLKYRLMRPILKLNYNRFRGKKKNSPWLSPVAIDFFDKFLTAEMIGLEYGSGFSTQFYAERINKIVALEHHEEWYKKIKKGLKETGLNNVEYRHIPKGIKRKLKTKDYFPQLHKDFEIHSAFLKYFEYVKQYPNEYFDFVIIDGRARVETGLNSMPKLKSGGVMILDNSERERYKPLMDILCKWPHAHTTTGLTDTSFFIKP